MLHQRKILSSFSPFNLVSVLLIFVSFFLLSKLIYFYSPFFLRHFIPPGARCGFLFQADLVTFSSTSISQLPPPSVVEASQ